MVENHRIEIDILDMKEMTVVDKAQILYNHLYFKGIPTDYFQNIKTNKAYRAIVSHKNYTPRIIEYVTSPWVYNKMPAKEYASFIMDCFACPDEIWHEEFTERLTQADRIFMTTLFSLTDKCVDVTIHRRAYEKRLSNTPGIDVTKHQWEETHRRLYNSMVIDVNLQGTRCLSVVNPSVNDFLKKYLDDNPLEKQAIYDNISEFAQVKKLFPDRIDDFVINGKILDLHFADPGQKQIEILSRVCSLKIFDHRYDEMINDFLKDPLFYSDALLMQRAAILVHLFTEEMKTFYHTKDWLAAKNLIHFFEWADLDEYVIFFSNIRRCGNGDIFQPYYDALTDSINNMVCDYIENAFAADYYQDYDVSAILEQCPPEEQDDEYDFSAPVHLIEEMVKEDIEKEIREKLTVFPDSIRDAITIHTSYLGDVTDEIEGFLFSWHRAFYDDYDEQKGMQRGDENEEMCLVDHIFDR